MVGSVVAGAVGGWVRTVRGVWCGLLWGSQSTKKPTGDLAFWNRLPRVWRLLRFHFSSMSMSFYIRVSFIPLGVLFEVT